MSRLLIIITKLMRKGKLVITEEADDGEPPKSKKIHKLDKPAKLSHKHTSLSLAANIDESLQERVEGEDFSEQPVDNESKIAHLAICFPDSILQIPQTSALRAYFISEIARISSIFKVDEIVVLKDRSYTPKSEKFVPAQYIARNLQYLETPQYLRKHLFKMHPDLNNVGLMNPIQAHHHFKGDEVSPFREGVALERPTKQGQGSWVDVGLKKQAKMDQLVLPLTRVTLRLHNYDDPDAPFYQAEAVARQAPRVEKGLYWGYDVRIAKSLKQMTDNAYDHIFLCNHSDQSYGLPQLEDFSQTDLGAKRVLILFAGTQNLRTFIERDENAKWDLSKTVAHLTASVKLAGMGVKQLRLEERMFVTLSRLTHHTL